MPPSKLPRLPLAGGCPCGAVRYTVGSMPLSVYACHCTECQRRSGSAFALNMAVAAADFRIAAGTPKAWRGVSPTGVATASWFCGDCGGRIYGQRDGRAETVIVRAGTLDDTSWLKPAAHFFVRSAQPWENLAGDATCYEAAPPDMQTVAAAWRRMMSE